MRLFFVFLVSIPLIVGVFVVTTHSTQAQSGCTHVVGTGNGEHASLKAALTAIGNNGAGKVVCIREKSTPYKEQGDSLIVSSSGTSTSWLVIKPHPDNTSSHVRFDDPHCTNTCVKDDANKYDAVIEVTGAYVELRNVEIIRSNGPGVEVEDTHDVKLINIKATNIQSHGIQIYDSDDVLVDGCQVKNATLGGDQGAGENVRTNRFSQRVIFQNCLIEEDGSPDGGVLNSGQSDNIILRNNELFFNESNNLHMGNGDNITYENNLVSTTCAAQSGAGFYRQAEDYNWYTDPPFKGTNLTIKNNLIVNMGKGISFNGCQGATESQKCPLKNVDISNNTIVGIGIPNNPNAEKESKEYAFNAMINLDRPVENIRVENVAINNNIFHTYNGPEADYNSNWVGTFTFAGNLWSDMTDVPTLGNSLVSNWSGVFAGTGGQTPSLTTCVNNRINPDLYRVAAAYAGKGADVSKVGIGRGSNTPFSSPTPMPDWDLNDDGDTDVFDFNQFVRKVIRSEENWSRLASFIAALRSL